MRKLHIFSKWMDQFTFASIVQQLPFPAHPHRHLTILTGVSSYLTVALIHISMMIRNFQCIFMYLLSVCLHSLEKRLSKSSSQFLKFFCYWVVWVPSMFRVLTSYLIYEMQIFFFFFCHSVGCLFTLLIVYFAVQKLVSLM